MTSWPVAHQASLSMEFSRQEYWSRFPFPIPGDLPNSGSSSLISRTFFCLSPCPRGAGPEHHGHCVCVMRGPQKFLHALTPGHLFHGIPGLSRCNAVLYYTQTSSALSGLSPAEVSLSSSFTPKPRFPLIYCKRSLCIWPVCSAVSNSL